MPHPEFYPEGVTPRIKDSKYRRWVKILGAAKAAFGGSASSNPRIGDSLRAVKRKVLMAVRGD